ncbi:outer membrane protein assembly factor BamB family protein [Streptomyces mimosae]|uniref:outer membrane protein assembly factor BamB family protein n=1 Tax=Streptomyces mimosae TaxID=2586635 RepID=UPI00186B2E85|nr:PQQ-binding-like beta-propeller repeat protein [Streptomyces mimosae]
MPILVVVLVLALGGGGWFLFGPGSDDSNTRPPMGATPETPGGVVWSLNEDVAENARIEGVWVVGEDTLVKAVDNVFTAYALADGSVLWTQELEGDAICAPPTTTEDGLIVVGHGSANCGQNITQMDLTTGETGWSRPLEPEEDPGGFAIAIAGSSYAIHSYGGWNLHRIADGEVISASAAVYSSLHQDVNRTDFADANPPANGQEICAVDAVAGGERLIRRRTCATVTDAANGTTSAPFFKLEQIDPETGDTMWSLDVPEGRWVSKFHSTTPLVVSLRSEEFGPDTELLFVDEAGQITGQVPVATTGVAENDVHLLLEEWCRDDIVVYNQVDECGGTAVAGDTFYASPSGMAGGNPVTAMDVTTGAVKWAYETDQFYKQTVLAADEEGVIIHQASHLGSSGQVARISADGQTVEPLFRTDEAWIQPSFYIAWVNGQLAYSVTDFSLEQDLSVYGPEGEAVPLTEESEGRGEAEDGTEGAGADGGAAEGGGEDAGAAEGGGADAEAP